MGWRSRFATTGPRFRRPAGEIGRRRNPGRSWTTARHGSQAHDVLRHLALDELGRGQVNRREAPQPVRLTENPAPTGRKFGPALRPRPPAAPRRGPPAVSLDEKSAPSGP